MSSDVVIISDLHLGAAVSKRRTISKFLDSLPYSVSLLVINGDLIDHPKRALKKQDWNILSQLRSFSKYKRLIWVRGNHDPHDNYIAHLIGAEFVNRFRFTQREQDFLCVHGDQWDKFITSHPILTHIGDSIYFGLMRISKRLARWAKHKSKQVHHCREQVARGALEYVYSCGYSAVCCGHTHHAEQAGEQYYNSGCWTEEGCSYLLVRNGRIEIKTFS